MSVKVLKQTNEKPNVKVEKAKDNKPSADATQKPEQTGNTVDEKQLIAQLQKESIKTLQIIRGIVLQDKAFVERAIGTGYSYFKGNTRLCKLVHSSKSIVLEINTVLPKDLVELRGMEKISPARAQKKHLGTMKYMYRTYDAGGIDRIVKAALEEFYREEKKGQVEVKETVNEKVAG